MSFDTLTNDTEKSMAPFFSKRMLSITFNCLWILSLVLIVFWPRKDLFEFIEMEKTPMIFLGVSVAALLMSSYVNLRCGHGEMSPDDFFTRLENKEAMTIEKEYDFFPHGLVQSLLHTVFLLLLVLPLVIVSAAISGISLAVFAKALSVLFTASLLCRMFGFLVYLCWGRWSQVGYLLTRTFFIVFIFATGTFATFANPVLLVHGFWKGKEILSRSTVTGYLLYMMIVTAAILLLTLGNQAMVRRRKHMGKSA